MESDLADIFRIHSDPRTYRHHPDGLMRTVAQARAVLDRWTDDWRAAGVGYRMVRMQQEPTVVGCAGVRLLSAPGYGEGPMLNLFYRIDPEFWGRGLATEAARAVILDAHRTHPDVPVTARIALANHPSLAVAQRIGLLPTPWQDPDDPIPHRVFRLPSS